jgi:hypothetical protein
MHDLSSGKLKSDIHFLLVFVSLLFFATVYILLLQSYIFYYCNLALPEVFLQLVFCFISVFILFNHTDKVRFFATTHNSWLQSRTPTSCNHTLVQFCFSFCSHRNKPAVLQSHTSVFAITHYPGSQSYSK